MFKKIITLTNFSQQEKSVARVRHTQQAELSRKKLSKMGISVGVSNSTAISGRNFLPNAVAVSSSSSSSSSIISLSWVIPWMESNRRRSKL